MLPELHGEVYGSVEHGVKTVLRPCTEGRSWRWRWIGFRWDMMEERRIVIGRHACMRRVCTYGWDEGSIKRRLWRIVCMSENRWTLSPGSQMEHCTIDEIPRSTKCIAERHKPTPRCLLRYAMLPKRQDIKCGQDRSSSLCHCGRWWRSPYGRWAEEIPLALFVLLHNNTAADLLTQPFSSCGWKKARKFQAGSTLNSFDRYFEVL